MHRRSAAVLVASLLVLGGTGPEHAQAATPAEIIASLERQRTANGIPGGLQRDAALDRGCAKHNRYLSLNPSGGSLHDEVRGRPGYTTDGHVAGQSSVMAVYDGFDWQTNPFEYAPFHLAQMLNPALRTTGADASHGYTCVVVKDWRERKARAELKLYSYPGPNTTGVRFEDHEYNERPFTPGDLLGFPQPAVTGPHIYVLGHGPTALPLAAMRVSSASLVGPKGAVPVKWLDNSHPKASNHLPRPSAMVIAPKPVAPGSYCATVTYRVEGLPGLMTHRIPFTTRGASAGSKPPLTCRAAPATQMRAGKISRRGTRVSMRVSVSARAKGRWIAALERGGKSRRMKVGATQRRGSRRTARLSGAIPSSLGHTHAFATVTFKRTDGGPHGFDVRVLKVSR